MTTSVTVALEQIDVQVGEVDANRDTRARAQQGGPVRRS